MIDNLFRHESGLDALESYEFDEANDDVFEGLAAMHTNELHAEIVDRLTPPRRRRGRPRKHPLRDRKEHDR